jgi:hypothetical protein
MTYDCTADVKEHIRKVAYWLDDVAHRLQGRAKHHDASKLQPPEKKCFDVYTPKLKELTFGTQEYKDALAAMGEGLAHHYKANRHHPEHFKDGINGMTLVDVVEMVCDWMAACEAKGVQVDLDAACARFGIEPQLRRIINNTLQDVDYWNTIGGVPVVYFSPDSIVNLR